MKLLVNGVPLLTGDLTRYHLKMPKHDLLHLHRSLTQAMVSAPPGCIEYSVEIYLDGPGNIESSPPDCSLDYWEDGFDQGAHQSCQSCDECRIECGELEERIAVVERWKEKVQGDA